MTLEVAGNWVLRSPEGAFIDHDRYRHDLAARHGLDFNYGLDAACDACLIGESSGCPGTLC